MTHGYCMAAVFHARMLPALAQHYRIVLFDNLSWGLNSRVDNIGDALDSAEKAEQWLVSWWHALIETMGTELTIHEERMLQDFDFPIAFINGTRDFFGSAEGSDAIVKNNKHFESGRSQIFKLQNSGHNVFLDNVDQLTT
eukprot:CAMPEP_0170464868 /NCGR_PEP_ID=MMETSP0123-20130129/9419_1 /TAXON_ID=182087 /ORGANISM="Favella ehrenbergii, Strain Fehren 1" /LENGTH=139 /DNA_ID=CAMNT_0010730609 /DNA_START=186 /DNA_END=606 /DNA_ORIENTATION=+